MQNHITADVELKTFLLVFNFTRLVYIFLFLDFVRQNTKCDL